MAYALHRDPTLEGAQRLEISEKRCSVCQRERVLSSGKSICSQGKVFPFCRGDKKLGFKLRLS